MLKADELQEAFKKVEKDNWILRSFLKGQDSSEVDKLVNELHQELFAGFSCYSCLNCCKSIVPLISENEIKVIAKRIALTEDELKSKYLEQTATGFRVNKVPCLFLTNTGCSIYECRPLNCREYPFTSSKYISSRLINLVENCEICPVVFEIFERLKEHYQYEFKTYKKMFNKLWG